MRCQAAIWLLHHVGDYVHTWCVAGRRARAWKVCPLPACQHGMQPACSWCECHQWMLWRLHLQPHPLHSPAAAAGLQCSYSPQHPLAVHQHNWKTLAGRAGWASEPGMQTVQVVVLTTCQRDRPQVSCSGTLEPSQLTVEQVAALVLMLTVRQPNSCTGLDRNTEPTELKDCAAGQVWCRMESLVGPVHHLAGFRQPSDGRKCTDHRRVALAASAGEAQTASHQAGNCPCHHSLLPPSHCLVVPSASVWCRQQQEAVQREELACWARGDLEIRRIQQQQRRQVR